MKVIFLLVWNSIANGPTSYAILPTHKHDELLLGVIQTMAHFSYKENMKMNIKNLAKNNKLSKRNLSM